MELVSWQRDGNSLQNIHFNVEKICGNIMTPFCPFKQHHPEISPDESDLYPKEF